MRANATTLLKTDVSTAVRTALSAGTGEKWLLVYSGTIPNTPGAAITTQVLLLEFEIDPDEWVVDDQGRLLTSALSDAVGLATDIARWARFIDGDGEVVMDVDVSAIGGAGFIKLVSIAVTEGESSAMATGYITL